MKTTTKISLSILLSVIYIHKSHAEQSFVYNDLVNHYAVQRAATPIAIDGRLDEFAWETAAQIDRFERILNDYDSISRPTRAKMLWDAENFYFAFSCQDPDAWAIFDAEDDPMWSEEVVEVFIDPDGDGENYLELEVNPLNAVVDLRIIALQPMWQSSKDWDIKGLQTAVEVHGSVNDSLARDLGWTAEIAIPWTAFADSIDGGGLPTVGDTWRLNLYRIERTAGRALKLQLDAITQRARPLYEELTQLPRESAADSLEAIYPENWRQYLDEQVRQRLAQLEDELAPIRLELEPLQKRHRDETEFTAWSEPYHRGFHHPARFGVVQFVD